MTKYFRPFLLISVLLLGSASFLQAQTHTGGGGTTTGGGGAAFPVTVTGGVSGAVPCFTSTTTEASGTLLALNVFLVGGGAGACPTSDAHLDDGVTTAATITSSEPVAATTYNATTQISAYKIGGSNVLTLPDATNGNTSVAVGPSAASGIVTTNNAQVTAVGNSACASETSAAGEACTGIGYRSLVLETGSADAALGGSSCTTATGNNVTCVGANTAVASAADTNETMLGQGVTGAGSNTATIGNASVTDVHNGGAADAAIVHAKSFTSAVATGTAPLTVTSTTPVANLNIPINQVSSASGAIPTIVDGNNPLVINCALTSGTTCLTTGETTAATTAGAVEYQITTLTTSTAIVLQLTQGANGPAAANAPSLINVSVAAAGGVAAATGGGFTGAPVSLITGAGSAAGATSGTGGTGGAYNLTTGIGGAGSPGTGNGGVGGSYAITTGNGGAAGGTTTNAGGAGGSIGETSGTGAQGAATGAGGAGGNSFYAGGVGGRGGATSGTGGAGGSIVLTGGAGGVATAGSTTGAGGNINLNPGAAGGTGTPGLQGVVLINGAPASYSTVLTSGTSWTSPVNIQRTSNVKITMVGGGNAGGTSGAATIGLPGGAGCTIIVEGTAATLGLVANTAYTYAIGSASGGSTTFNNGSATNTAAGGTAGGTLSSAAVGVGLGGVGGACTVNFGTVGTSAISIQGQAGSVGEILVITTTYQTGIGGSTPFGSGGQAVISGVVGKPGTGYGAGGSGGGVGTNAGGAGTAGAILIEISI